MSEELKKCPWCEEYPNIDVGSDGEGFGQWFLEHVCDHEGVTIDICMSDANKNTLVIAWNSRPEEDRLRKENAELREALENILIKIGGPYEAGNDYYWLDLCVREIVSKALQSNKEEGGDF